MMIIDPPVTPFSPREKIEEWIGYLRTLDDAPEVAEAIADAKRWLEILGAD